MTKLCKGSRWIMRSCMKRDIIFVSKEDRFIVSLFTSNFWLIPTINAVGTQACERENLFQLFDLMKEWKRVFKEMLIHLTETSLFLSLYWVFAKITRFKIPEVKMQVCLPRKAVVKMSSLLGNMFWQLLHDLPQLLDKING